MFLQRRRSYGEAPRWPGRQSNYPRRQCLRVWHSERVRQLLKADLGPAQAPHTSRRRQSRAFSKLGGWLLRLLRCGGGSQEGLLQPRSACLAHRGAQLQLLPGGRLSCRLAPGTMAAPGPQSPSDEMHPSLLAHPPLQLRPIRRRHGDPTGLFIQRSDHSGREG